MKRECDDNRQKIIRKYDKAVGKILYTVGRMAIRGISNRQMVTYVSKVKGIHD